MNPLLLLIYAIVLAQTVSPTSSADKVVNVKFCDLLKEPEKYDGLMIGIEANWDFGPEGSVLLPYPGSCGSEVESRPFWRKQVYVQLPTGEKLAAASEMTQRLVALHDETIRHPTRRIQTRVAIKGKLFVYKNYLKSKRGDSDFGYLATWPFVIRAEWMFET